MEWAALGFFAGVLINVTVVAYWGGQIRQSLESLHQEVPKLREARHLHANLLTEVMGDVKYLKDDVERLDTRMSRLEGKE